MFSIKLILDLLIEITKISKKMISWAKIVKIIFGSIGKL